MAVNLWENASLESGIDGWSGKNGASVSQSSDYASHGTYSLKETGGNVYAGIQCANREIIDASTQYTLHFEVYSTAADLDLSCRVVDQDGNWLNEVTPTIASSATWTQVTNTFTTGAGDTGIYWWIHKLDESADDIFYVDKIMLETGGSASAWVDYAGDVDVEVTPNLCTSSLVTYNPTITANTGLWEIGAYIYSTSGGVTVNPNLGTSQLQAHNPTVSVTEDVAVAPNLCASSLVTHNPTVTAFAPIIGTGITRIAMKLATIFRR